MTTMAVKMIGKIADDTAQAKMEALEKLGVSVVRNAAEIGKTLKGLIE